MNANIMFDYAVLIYAELRKEALALWFAKNIINPEFITEVILYNS
jgi:hypothetical protein